MSQSISDQLKFSDLTDKQKSRFKMICERVSKKEIGANKAYEYAQIDGETEDDLGFKGTFKDWLATASSYDWFGEKSNPNQQLVVQPDPPKKKTNVIVPILIGVTAALILYVVVKRMTAKEAKEN